MTLHSTYGRQVLAKAVSRSSRFTWIEYSGRAASATFLGDPTVRVDGPHQVSSRYLTVRGAKWVAPW